MAAPPSSELPEYFGVTEEEFNRNLKKWRKPTADFETLVISETIDPGTFCKNSLVVPIVTSSVFVLQGPANEAVTSVSFGKHKRKPRLHETISASLLI